MVRVEAGPTAQKWRDYKRRLERNSNLLAVFWPQVYFLATSGLFNFLVFPTTRASARIFRLVGPDKAAISTLPRTVILSV